MLNSELGLFHRMSLLLDVIQEGYFARFEDLPEVSQAPYDPDQMKKLDFINPDHLPDSNKRSWIVKGRTDELMKNGDLTDNSWGISNLPKKDPDASFVFFFRAPPEPLLTDYDFSITKDEFERLQNLFRVNTHSDASDFDLDFDSDQHVLVGPITEKDMTMFKELFSSLDLYQTPHYRDPAGDTPIKAYPNTQLLDVSSAIVLEELETEDGVYAVCDRENYLGLFSMEANFHPEKPALASDDRADYGSPLMN